MLNYQIEKRENIAMFLTRQKKRDKTKEEKHIYISYS